MPTAEKTLPPRISEFARDGREQLLRHVRTDIAELESELKTLRDTEKALKGNGSSAGATRARAGNGAKTTSRKPKRSRAAGPSATLTAPQVLRAMKSGHTQTSQIAKALKSTPTTIQRWMAKLKSENMVRQEGTGAKTRWTLTEKGMRAAAPSF